MSWIATALSLTGNLLVNKKRVEGFYVWIISNVLWVIIALRGSDMAQVVLFLCYAILNAHGIISWKRSSSNIKS